MELLPHQKAAVDDFVRRDGRMLLWADTGTGKTPTAIECARRVGATRVLYLAPSILKPQIRDEFDKWWEESAAIVVQGTKTARAMIWKQPGYQVTIANYEQLLNDGKEIAAYDPDFVIIDECQRFCAPATKTLKALRTLNPRFRLAMSGTPAPNALHEFWNMTDWVAPGHFHPNFWVFRKRECMMNPYFPAIIGYYDKRRVQSRFMSRVHRIRREDVLELPPLTEVRIPCQLAPAQRLAYERLKKDLLIELQNGQMLTVPNMLSLIMRLRQMADMPAILGVSAPEAKVYTFNELVGAISSKKIIVFSEFSTVANRLAAAYPNSRIVTGDTPQKERDRNFDEFRKDPAVRFLFLTSAARYGINLQEADTVIHFDLPWNDAGMDQRVARAWRYGQERPVTSYRIIAEHTVDEKMEKMIENKKQMTTGDLMEFFM